MRVISSTLALLLSSLCAFAAGTGEGGQKRFDKLAPHPRLYISQQQLDRAVAGRGAEYEDVCQQIEAAADIGLVDYQEPMKGLSDHDRSFKIQGRLISLAIQWHRTKDRKYLEAALQTVKAMKSWLDFGDEFMLWDGQNIAGIAVVYDLLYNDLTPEERKWFVEFARDNCIQPFLKVTGRGAGERRSWWQDIVSNWNPVCNSGPGMLALAMYEDIDEAQTVIDRVNGSFQPIIEYLAGTRGGWVEGLGYWNWTVHYMSVFYMSYERSTGEKHEGFRSDGFRSTLTFGTLFSPHAEPCGFGDNQHGGVDSTVLAAAEYLGHKDALEALQAYRKLTSEAEEQKRKLRKQKSGDGAESKPKKKEGGDIFYGPTNRLLVEPDAADSASPGLVQPLMFDFRKQGWAMVADRWPKPSVYASMKGGLIGGPHTHLDLLSWNGVVGIERMILNYNKAGYYDTSWQQRAWEIYERGSAVKNTIFIGGLGPYEGEYHGVTPEAKVSQHLTKYGAGIRLDATSAYWLTRNSPALVARLFATVDDRALLVVDHIKGRGVNPVEVRAHTEKKATFDGSSVLLEGEFEKARITFACDQKAVLKSAEALLTDPQAELVTVIRWQTQGSVRDVTLVSVLSRGDEPLDAAVKSDGSAITVTIKSGDWLRTLNFDDVLMPLNEGFDGVQQ
jgi:hypothetical protein